LSIGERFQLFFYSTGNIVGSVLAIGGLGLLFGGLIHSDWLAIVAGLYGVKTLVSNGHSCKTKVFQKTGIPILR
jgi:hypothetical protein